MIINYFDKKALLRYTVYLTGIAVGLFCIGCIKDAPLNVEADILSVDYNEVDFFREPQISNTEVRLFFNENHADISAYPLRFTLSRGATSNPKSGQIQNFSKTIEYIVTSESGEFHKTYKIISVNEKNSFVPLSFDFENYKIDDQYKYTVFHDMVDEKSLETWSSGNAGFVYSLSPIVKKQPELYPLQFTNEAYSGNHAALLVTKSTGTFGSGAKKPIAAGNIFLGAFDSGNVLGDPLKSTRFGLPIAAKPLSLEGYYKYKPGQQVIDQNSKPLSGNDSCSIIAVLFDGEELLARTGVNYLDGTNILTDPSILGTAILFDSKNTAVSDYRKFKIPFNYVSEPILKDFGRGRYQIALVLSSSKNGDRFVGAIGSMLVVDDLKLNIL